MVRWLSGSNIIQVHTNTYTYTKMHFIIIIYRYLYPPERSHVRPTAVAGEPGIKYRLSSERIAPIRALCNDLVDFCNDLVDFCNDLVALRNAVTRSVISCASVRCAMISCTFREIIAEVRDNAQCAARLKNMRNLPLIRCTNGTTVVILAIAVTAIGILRCDQIRQETSMTTSQTQQTSQTLRTILDPLCPETAQLLAPLDLWEDDRIDISLDASGKHFHCDIYRVIPGRPGEKYMASYMAKKFFSRIPEKQKLGDQGNAYSLAATDITCLIVNACWPQDRITWEPQAKQVFDFLLIRFMQQTIGSQERAAFKLHGRMPEIPNHYMDHPTLPLAPYQKVGVVTSFGQEGFGYLFEQGTGKTPTWISRMCMEAAAKKAREGSDFTPLKALIVVPKNIRMNWSREIKKFSTMNGRVTVLRGGQLKRVKLIIEALREEPGQMFTLVVASYGTVEKSWDAFQFLQWDFVGLDESHNIKNSRTRRFKRMIELRETADKRCILTGTAVTKTLLDLYAQLEFLGEGMSGFVNYKQFKAFYARYERNEHSGQDVFKGYQNLPFLQERLSRVAYRVTKAEALPDLMKQCPRSYDIIEIEMTPKQREIYKQLQKQLAVEIQEAMDDPETAKRLTANNILVRLLRLAQITSGFVSWDKNVDMEGNVTKPKQVERLNPNPKMEEFIRLVKESSPKTKLIAWMCFIPDIQELSRRLTAEGIGHVTYYGGTSDKDREIAERSFNWDKNVKVFIGNPAAGGVGLNLWGYPGLEYEGTPDDHGMNADHTVYYSQNWSMVHRSQSADRNHRRGTRVPIRYTTMICTDTVDEIIHDRVTGQIKDAETIQDVREIMKRVLVAVGIDEDDDSGSVDIDDTDEAGE